MTRFLRHLFHFLGSVYFALLLIFLVTMTVIAGTFIESMTDSHANAARFTYSSPAFVVLLCLFFVNILFAALRRWPFKKQHTPFLLVHLGLLMVLTGCIVKVSAGLQGHMTVLEGGATNRVLVDQSQVLHLARPGDQEPLQLNLPTSVFGELQADLGDQRSSFQRLLGQESTKTLPQDLEIKLIEFAPHSAEKLEFWIKHDKAHIAGLPPIPVSDTPPNSDTMIVAPLTARFPETGPVKWQLFALRTNDLEAAFTQVYLQDCTLILGDPCSGRDLLHLQVKECIGKQLPIAGGELSCSLSLSLNAEGEFSSPALNLEYLALGSEDPIYLELPLSGNGSGLLRRTEKAYKGGPPLDARIERPASLVLVEDGLGDNYVLAFDPFGRVYCSAYRQDTISQIYVYDEGYGGYGTAFKTPEAPFLVDPRRIQIAARQHLGQQLQTAINEAPVLSPPLELLQLGCQQQNTDLVNCLVNFLEQWHRQGTSLYPLMGFGSRHLPDAFEHIPWKSNPDLYKAAIWIANLHRQVEAELDAGLDLFAALERIGWPLLDHLKQQRQGEGRVEDDETAYLLTVLSQQVLTVVHQLPEPEYPEQLGRAQSAHLLSALLRTFGIQYQQVFPEELPEGTFAQAQLIIECPVTHNVYALPPIAKYEDRRPLILLEVSSELGQKEQISLSYDPSGSGLRWPVLGGRYLASFQPRSVALPYTVQLKQARQVNYPSSPQAFTYESDLRVSSTSLGYEQEPTLSMNHVHETPGAYRFYMASLTPPDESSAKRIQLVVNRDPGKYWLTYPGGLLVSLATLWLFWLKPGRKKS